VNNDPHESQSVSLEQRVIRLEAGRKRLVATAMALAILLAGSVAWQWLSRRRAPGEVVLHDGQHRVVFNARGLTFSRNGKKVVALQSGADGASRMFVIYGPGETPALTLGEEKPNGPMGLTFRSLNSSSSLRLSGDEIKITGAGGRSVLAATGLTMDQGNTQSNLSAAKVMLKDRDGTIELEPTHLTLTGPHGKAILSAEPGLVLQDATKRLTVSAKGMTHSNASQ